MGNFKSSLIDGQLKVTNGITGALNGNASSATKATQDSDGNKINTTYLKLSGGTMIGGIDYKVDEIDASLSNNNISHSIYPTTFNILDKNNRILNRIECIPASDGNISSYLYIRNYKTDGSMVAQKGIKLTMAKNGTLTYDVADANNFRSAISAVNKAGDTLTGNLSYNMNGSTQIPFKVYGGDVNGQGVSVGAGGATIVGSGESAKACESLLTATTEELWITSDNAIKFYTNCQTIGNKVGVFLNASRAFYPDTNNTGTLGTSSNKWNNVYATTFTGNLSGNATNVTQKKSLTGKSHSNYGTNNGYLPDMSFIAFWNGAYNSSNNSNLTYAHQGIIQCKPTTLYSNASGTTGTIKLSQTAANFSYLEIFYCDNNNKQHHSIKISEPNNKLTSLDTGESYESDKNLYFRTTSYTISGTSMTVKSYGYMNFWQVSGSDHCGVNPEKNNYIKIIKVLGYK